MISIIIVYLVRKGASSSPWGLLRLNEVTQSPWTTIWVCDWLDLVPCLWWPGLARQRQSIPGRHVRLRRWNNIKPTLGQHWLLECDCSMVTTASFWADFDHIVDKVNKMSIPVIQIQEKLANYSLVKGSHLRQSVTARRLHVAVSPRLGDHLSDEDLVAVHLIIHLPQPFVDVLQFLVESYLQSSRLVLSIHVLYRTKISIDKHIIYFKDI